MALTRIKSSNIADETVVAADIADGSITDAKIQTGVSSSKLTGNLPAISGASLTNLTAANISGALPAIDGSNLTGVSTDTSAMENNIAILAFKTQAANNLAKFNLIDQVIDEYKDDTGLGTQTDVDRIGSTAADGYISTISTTTGVNQWTIEGHFFVNATDINFMLFDLRNNAATKGLTIYNNSNKTINVGVGNGSGFVNTTWSNAANGTFDPNAWIKWAVTRTANRDISFYCRQVGISGGYTLNHKLTVPSSTYGTITQPESGQDKVYFGGTYNNNGSPGGSYYLAGGYVDEQRISSVARHSGTSAYPSQSSAYSNDSDTVALMGYNNNLTDSSSNGHTVTTGTTAAYNAGGTLSTSHALTMGGTQYISLPNGAFSVADTAEITTTNATGTLISTANTALSAPTTGDICMLVENFAGTATLNTDLKAYVSRNGGTGWDQATLVDKGTWGSGTKKIVSANNVAFSNSASGTDMRYKIEWANQASGSKETRIHATSLAWA